MAGPDRQGFVRSLMPIAAAYAGRTSIPAAVLIAIAAHESNFGNAGGNMLFGIKGPGKSYATHEIVDGKRVDMDDSFRTYDSPQSSFDGFVDLVSQGRYAQAWRGLQESGDWREFLRGINRAGYATDPTWADKIANFAGTTIGPLVEQLNPLGASTAEAAELDQVSTSATQGEITKAEEALQAAQQRIAAAQGRPEQDESSPLTSRREAAQRANTLRRQDIKAAQDDAEQAEKRVSSLRLRLSTEETRAASQARAQAGATARGQRTAARQDTADRAKGEAAARAQGRAGEFSWGPDGIPYGIYDDDGKLRLLSDAEQKRVIRLMEQGAITREVETAPTPNAIDDPRGYGPAYTDPIRQRVAAQLPPGIVAERKLENDEQALNNAYKQAQIAKMQNDLVPGLEQVLRNRDAAIKGIKARFVSGELNADQATAYYKYVNDYTAAAYRGTTPMQIEQERNRQENERRRDGMTHLNQRISSGSSLASNLTSTYLQAAAAAHLGPGQSHGIDPLTLARAFVDDVGGGDMSDFARELVMGGRGGQAPIEESLPLPPWLQNQEEEGMPPQQPAGAPIGAGAPAPPAPPMPGYPPWAGRHY